MRVCGADEFITLRRLTEFQNHFFGLGGRFVGDGAIRRELFIQVINRFFDHLVELSVVRVRQPGRVVQLCDNPFCRGAAAFNFQPVQFRDIS